MMTVALVIPTPTITTLTTWTTVWWNTTPRKSAGWHSFNQSTFRLFHAIQLFQVRKVRGSLLAKASATPEAFPFPALFPSCKSFVIGSQTPNLPGLVGHQDQHHHESQNCQLHLGTDTKFCRRMRAARPGEYSLSLLCVRSFEGKEFDLWKV